MIMPSLLAASSFLIPPHLSNAEKAELIAPYFEPSPNAMLSLDALDFKYQRSKNPNSLFGEITINPPKDICFRIEKNNIDRDETICKRKTWRFTVGDLANDGSLNLKIWIKEQEAPILLSWTSHYRKGRLRPHGLEAQKKSLSVTIRECQIKSIEENKRLVTVSFLGKTDDLQFILPAKGSELKQEREMRVLLTMEPSPPAIPAPAKNSPEEKAKPQIPQAPPPLNWDIKGKSYYSLSADRIMSRTAPTPGMHGVCRYTDSGYGPREEHGLIECHQTSNYQYLNIPLPCLKSGEAS